MITTSCELGFDADLLLRAARGEIGRDESLVRDHVGACEACSRRLRALRAAKDAWADRVGEPEAVMRARDARAMTQLRERDARSRRSPSTFLAGVIVGAAVVGALVLFRARPAPDERVLASAAASSVVAAPSAAAAPAPSLTAPAPAVAPAPAARALVVKRACSSCDAGKVDLGPGVTLPEHAAVDVPSGGSLLLAFSLAEAVAEPDHGLTVEGPAHAVVDRGAVDVERGKAKLVGDVGGAGDVRVRTPHLFLTAARGRLTIDSDEGGTRLAVLTGTASIATAAGEQRQLGAGDRLQVDARGRVVAVEPFVTAVVPAPAPPPAAAAPDAPAATPDERWSRATRALDQGSRGDRARAESELRRLVSETEATQPLHRRASFRLAELELARGDAREARPRLDAVMRGPEEQLAEDAAVLLARSYPTPGERAVVWAAYLGTSPRSPRRERAILERVRALVASGGDARAAATACEGSSPACVESRALGTPSASR